MIADKVEHWIDRLVQASECTLGPVAAALLQRQPLTTDQAIDPSTFVDERGHRRTTDRPMLTWLTRPQGTMNQPFLDQQPAERPAADRHRSLDLELWENLAQGLPMTRPLGLGPLEPWTPASGPIEVWTERELSALHALWHLESLVSHSQRTGSPHDHSLTVARWHVENTQPDNATNHPWAIHVFIALWASDASGNPAFEAELYAQTQLHNCQVSLGRPDRLSALILIEAARALRDSQHAQPTG
jgi:hypothetical protein